MKFIEKLVTRLQISQFRRKLHKLKLGNTVQYFSINEVHSCCKLRDNFPHTELANLLGNHTYLPTVIVLVM